LNRQVNAIETGNKQLEMRSRILTTQQGLISATADSRIGELGVMDGLTTIESVKLNIAQQQANIKLASLTSQIQLERDVLELNIQQQQATIAGDKLKQQIAEKQAEREVILSKAAYDKLLVKGNLADPLEKRAAELDLSSKLDAQALTRSNRGIIAQQEQASNYSAYAQRVQLDYTQKRKLQSTLAEVANTRSETEKAELSNRLFNAIGSQRGTEYYKEWADAVVKEAKLNPVVFPQFSSPYDPRSNYNRPGVADPTKLAPSNEVNYRSGAGGLDFSQSAPNLQGLDTSRFQRDAQARYAEYVANPIKIEFSPQVREATSQGRRQERSDRQNDASEIKPIVINNLNVTNDMKIQVADSKEGKSAVENNFLESFEGIVRLAKEKYQ
jgi:hypothetical protein